MSLKTPINNGLSQTDLDFANFKALRANLSDYAGSGLLWNSGTGKFDTTGGGGSGGGPEPLITVSVKDAPYNAVGDGVADDTTAIQAAINHVSSIGGGTVFFPRGIYLCNGAFDGSDNSILQIPFATSAVGLTLLGETHPQGNNSYIKTTKTGTGTAPALLACGPYVGTGVPGPSQFSVTSLVIRNMVFLVPDNPSIYGLRLEVACRCVVEDVWVEAGAMNTQPTHGTVGVWMPASGNYVIIAANRVFCGGFDTGFRVGEHFRSAEIYAFRNNTGLEFTMCNNGPSWVNMVTMQNVSDVKFSGFHAVQLLLDAEHAQAGVGWYAPGTAIVDPGNNGRGEIRYGICTSNVGAVAGPITSSGGNYLTLTDFYTGITTFAPSGSIASNTVYIGTDARLVSISGGTKLEARNTGTGTWVEAARWTNP